eukprot:TRINITY_DN67768_c7_g2_i1.p1 TRINITY_DN67768_c7_g2~~TRINITY_DN67768_c7_g2_i1.p1  ORF type:complete len:868 (-),score=84.91 TRINITY_DN67768_c7_g2_i1:87-2690(-)
MELEKPRFPALYAATKNATIAVPSFADDPVASNSPKLNASRGRAGSEQRKGTTGSGPVQLPKLQPTEKSPAAAAPTEEDENLSDDEEERRLLAKLRNQTARLNTKMEATRKELEAAARPAPKAIKTGGGQIYIPEMHPDHREMLTLKAKFAKQWNLFSPERIATRKQKLTAARVEAVLTETKRHRVQQKDNLNIQARFRRELQEEEEAAIGSRVLIADQEKVEFKNILEIAAAEFQDIELTVHVEEEKVRMRQEHVANREYWAIRESRDLVPTPDQVKREERAIVYLSNRAAIVENRIRRKITTAQHALETHEQREAYKKETSQLTMPMLPNCPALSKLLCVAERTALRKKNEGHAAPLAGLSHLREALTKPPENHLPLCPALSKVLNIKYSTRTYQEHGRKPATPFLDILEKSVKIEQRVADHKVKLYPGLTKILALSQSEVELHHKQHHPQCVPYCRGCTLDSPSLTTTLNNHTSTYSQPHVNSTLSTAQPDVHMSEAASPAPKFHGLQLWKQVASSDCGLPRITTLEHLQQDVEDVEEEEEEEEIEEEQPVILPYPVKYYPAMAKIFTLYNAENEERKENQQRRLTQLAPIEQFATPERDPAEFVPVEIPRYPALSKIVNALRLESANRTESKHVNALRTVAELEDPQREAIILRAEEKKIRDTAGITEDKIAGLIIRDFGGGPPLKLTKPNAMGNTGTRMPGGWQQNGKDGVPKELPPDESRRLNCWILEDKGGKTEPTQQEVETYAAHIGIDPNADWSLLWIARQGLTTPLPTGWRPCCTNEAEVYYFNFWTGESSWEHPLDSYWRNMVHREKLKRSRTVPEGLELLFNVLASKLPPQQSVLDFDHYRGLHLLVQTHDAKYD